MSCLRLRVGSSQYGLGYFEVKTGQTILHIEYTVFALDRSLTLNILIVTFFTAIQYRTLFMIEVRQVFVFYNNNNSSAMIAEQWETLSLLNSYLRDFRDTFGFKSKIINGLD